MIGRPTNEDAPGLIVKNAFEIGLRMTDRRLFEDNRGSNDRGNAELFGPCRGSVQNGEHLRSREASSLSRLGLQPDSTVGTLYNAIVETLRYKVPKRHLPGPLPEENEHGDPVLVVEAATGPCARAGTLPRFELGKRFDWSGCR